MKLRNVVLLSAALFFSTASFSATSYWHTWVAMGGNDATSNGTWGKPFATFQAAANTTAPGGMISVVDTGDYGPLIIGQSITIDGSNLVSIAMNLSDSGAPAIYILNQSASSIKVTLKNLTLNGMGDGQDGILFAGPGNLIVDNCLITGFINDGIEMSGGGAENAVIRNTLIENNGKNGFEIDDVSGAVASLSNVTIQGVSNNAVNLQSGTVQVSNSVLTQNGAGVKTYNGATVSLESTMITSNGIAVCAYPTTKVRMENNDIFDNGMGVANCGGQVKTNGNNRDSGNTNGNSILAADVSTTVLF